MAEARPPRVGSESATQTHRERTRRTLNEGIDYLDGIRGPIWLTDGDYGEPALGWVDEPSSGLYRIPGTPGKIGMSVDGMPASVWQMGSTDTQLLVPQGTLAKPGLSIFLDTDTGLYWVSADHLGLTAGGVQALVATKVGSVGQVLIPGALNVGPSTSAVTAGDVHIVQGVSIGTWADPGVGELKVSGVVNVGPAAAATVAGSGHFINGISVGTYSAPGVGEVRVTNRVAIGTGLAPLAPLHVAATFVGQIATIDQLGATAGNLGMIVRTLNVTPTVPAFQVLVGALPYLWVGGAGLVGINAIANAFMTVGLTINQAAAVNEALALKSSSVAHGMTAFMDTDTYLSVTPVGGGPAGGATIHGGSEGTVAIELEGNATTNNTTKSTAGLAHVQVSAWTKSGTTSAAPAANTNLFGVRHGGSMRFLVDAEGDVHCDAGGAVASAGFGYHNYDEYDDAQLVRALAVEVAAPGLVRSDFDQLLAYTRRDLEVAGIATFNDGPGEDGSRFVNYSALTRLLSGAAWQSHQRILALEARLLALEGGPGGAASAARP